MTTIADQKLKQHFGYNSFRGYQKEITDNLIAGNSAMVIMPTGGGKSICYQIPAIVREGIGIIISPLIALMQDQVNSLRSNGISTEFINSSLQHPDKVSIKNKIEAGEVDLLYVAPEKLLEPNFYNWIKTLKISLFAIDEAHCVSQWGHDFRKEYVKLSCIANDFPYIPRIALTATANELTRQEISNRLQLNNSPHFMSGFDRPNIHYTIQEKRDEKKQLVQYIENNHQNECGVVYCLSRKRTEEFAELLRRAGFNALHYHAGLPNDVKSEYLERFLKEDNIIMVATIAFGMGIDKPNVRFVCHVDLPSSIESYYQETGRAGRDGLPSYAWMLYGMRDVVLRKGMLAKSEAEPMYKRIEDNNLNSMFTLCEVTQCRRQTLIEYFGDTLKDSCNNCDNCDSPPETFDASIVSQKAMSAVLRTDQRFGVNYLIDVLLGEDKEKIIKNKHNELSVFGVGDELSGDDWKTLFRQLTVMKFFDVDPQYGSIKLTNKCKPILKSEQSIRLGKFKDKTKKTKKKKDVTEFDHLSLDDQTLFSQLKAVRLSLSKELNVPAFVILNNNSLLSMVEVKPTSAEEMMQVNGMGVTKVNNFGTHFLEVLNS